MIQPAKRDAEPAAKTQDWASLLAALLERIERLEADVRRLQSQGSNRA